MRLFVWCVHASVARAKQPKLYSQLCLSARVGTVGNMLVLVGVPRMLPHDIDTFSNAINDTETRAVPHPKKPQVRYRSEHIYAHVTSRAH